MVLIQELIDEECRIAEASIYAKTGLHMKVVAAKGNSDVQYEQAVHVTASALNLDIEHLYSGSRRMEYAQMRQVISHLLRKYFPHLSYRQIGKIIGGYNYSTVMYFVSTANDLLGNNDPFINKYKIAENALKQWQLQSTV